MPLFLEGNFLIVPSWIRQLQLGIFNTSGITKPFVAVLGVNTHKVKVKRLVRRRFVLC